MSIEASLSTAMTEEVSGWWPSERSAKSRFKALFSRTKLERLTRQNRVASTPVRPDVSQSLYSRRVAPAPVAAHAEGTNGDLTYPSTLTGYERAAQRLKSQKSLPSIHPTYPRRPVGQPVYDELALASPVTSQPVVDGKTSRNVSRSTTDSSVHTLNSVDPPTEPSLSDDHSVHTTHTSFSSYASSSSYAAEPLFNVADSHDVPTPNDPRPEMCTPTPDDPEVLCMYKQTPKKHTRPLPSLTHTLDPLGAANSHDGIFVQKPLPPIPVPSRQLGRTDRRISIVAPLPEPGHIRKTSARYRCEIPDTSSRSATPTPTPPSSRPSSVRSRSSSYTQDSADGGRKRAASYSLFPRTPSIGQQKLPINGIPSPPATSQSNPQWPRKSIDVEKGDLTRPPPLPPPPSRDPRRNGKVLYPSTNLGPGSSEELQAIEIPSTEEGVNPRHPPRLARPPRQSALQRQKSMPCLVRPWTPSSGPPPIDPLPALPPVASGCLPLCRKHNENNEFMIDGRVQR